MKKDFMLILVNTRKKEAVTVQKILTEWGCIIKTRLGIHDGVLDSCSETGYFVLELVGDVEKHRELERKLNLLECVNAQLVEMEMNC